MRHSIEGVHYKSSKTIRVDIEHDIISNITEINSKENNRWIAPGLVDLQVNGFKGIDFNQEGSNIEDVARITEYLWETGITTYFPTFITNSDVNIRHAIQNIVKACQNKCCIQVTNATFCLNIVKGDSKLNLFLGLLFSWSSTC